MRDNSRGITRVEEIENFPFESSARLPFPKEFIRALGITKQACAIVNRNLDVLSSDLAQYISQAAQEVIDGKLDKIKALRDDVLSKPFDFKALAEYIEKITPNDKQHAGHAISGALKNIKE